MRQTLRTLAAGAALALMLGGAAWAQDAATDEATGEAAQAAPADQSTVEGGPVEPTDQADGADTANTDESGNTSDDPAPQAEAQGNANEEAAGQPGGDLPIIGAPVQGGIDLQPASSSVGADLQWLDGMLMWIISGIVLFVMGLLLWVIVRYNARRNPDPAGFTHNSPLEIAWTIVPIVILIFIGAFSLPVLFEEMEIPEADVHVKATGFQWFWEYEYLDEGVLFSSYMIGYGEPQMTDAPDDPVRADLVAAGYSEDEYRLATDTALILPSGATVVMTITGGDVIHSWTIPAFGVKQDAVPGRLAQIWFDTPTEGIFFGQCSELCGKDHPFMPITVRVVSPEAYEAWLATAREEFPAS